MSVAAIIVDTDGVTPLSSGGSLPVRLKSARTIRGVYSYAITDLAGNAGNPYTYLTLFNPAASGVIVALKKFDYNAYAVAAATTKVSARLSRISAHSAGTLVTSSTGYAKHKTSYSDGLAEVRFTNVTVTQVADIKPFSPPVVITAVGAYGAPELDLNPRDEDEEVILAEGQGVSIYQAGVGNVNSTYNLRWLWEEYT